MRKAPANLAICGAFVLALLAVSACVPMPQSREIGVVRAVGPAAFINGRAVRDGEALDQRDHLATGENSSIRAEFRRGGFVQLNERTDPTFQQFVQAAKCVIKVVLTFGEIFAENSESCSIETETPNASVTQQSGVNIRVSSGRTEVTVLRGSATLAKFPNVRLRGGEQVEIAGGRIVSRRTLSRRELRSVAGWQARYRFPRLVEVPNLRRLPLRQAEQRLRTLNLRLGSVRKKSELKFAPGTVVAQKPRAGSRVPAGRTVDVTVEAESVIVPTVTGLSLKRATDQLKRQGFRVGRISREATGRARANFVLEQRPGSGARASPGAAVDIVVEAESVVVPGVTGLSLGRAAEQLKRQGFRVGKISRRATGKARANTVLDQRPRSGARAAPGAGIALVVEASSVQVPSVTGLSLRDARSRLGKLGLRVGRIDRRAVRRPRPDTVLEQRPSAGRQVSPGTRVDLVVAAPFVDLR